jgi:hypothetical protein
MRRYPERDPPEKKEPDPVNHGIGLEIFTPLVPFRRISRSLPVTGG